jgi:hypothetical protein
MLTEAEIMVLNDLEMRMYIAHELGWRYIVHCRDSRGQWVDKTSSFSDQFRYAVGEELLNMDFSYLPNWPEDLNAVASDLESKITELSDQTTYASRLHWNVIPMGYKTDYSGYAFSSQNSDYSFFNLATATASQRCRAWLLMRNTCLN